MVSRSPRSSKSTMNDDIQSSFPGKTMRVIYQVSRRYSTRKATALAAVLDVPSFGNSSVKTVTCLF